MTVLSCEDIVKVFYRLEERLSIKRAAKRVREEKKVVPADL